MQNKTFSFTKSTLSQSNTRLVELMQQINFGCIVDLIIRNGQPKFDTPPRVIREIKFSGENGPRAEAAKGDFALKAQVVDLIKQMEAIQNGVIHRLEIKHGLPFMMTVEEDAT